MQAYRLETHALSLFDQTKDLYRLLNADAYSDSSKTEFILIHGTQLTASRQVHARYIICPSTLASRRNLAHTSGCFLALDSWGCMSSSRQGSGLVRIGLSNIQHTLYIWAIRGYQEMKLGVLHESCMGVLAPGIGVENSLIPENKILTLCLYSILNFVSSVLIPCFQNTRPSCTIHYCNLITLLVCIATKELGVHSGEHACLHYMHV